MEKTSGERLATVEAQLKQVFNVLKDINTKLDLWNQNYVPRKEIAEMFRSRDQDIQELKDGIKDTKKDSRSSRALWPAWAVVIMSAIANIITIWIMTGG